MKLLKKINSILLITSIIACFLFTNNVQAIQSENVQESQGNHLLLEKTITISENQKNETLQIPKQKKDEMEMLLKAKNPKSNIINTKNFSKVPGVNATSSSPGVGSNSVELNYSITSNTINRTITFEAKISKVNGIPPATLEVGQFIEYSNQEGNLFGGYWYHKSIFDHPSITWTTPQIYVGQKLSETIPAETKWWSSTGVAIAMFANETSDETGWATPFVLINRTGNIFPNYTDPWSGKKASDGLRTEWGKTSTPAKYTNIERGNAIASYISKYGDPKYEWKREKKPNYYEMHHIQPRALGGTNDLSNFIPIPYLNHQAISSWFMGYLDPNASIDPSDE